MATSRWMFTNDQLSNTPSRKTGIDADKELSYRQQAANLIQDMGQRLQVEQLCINTAIVYMHRFYMFRSFTRFPRNDMAPACLFLAAKVEEQPRKLEHVIKVAHACLNRDHNTPTPDPKTEAYLEQAQQLVINENILLQTLGFEVTVDHPHTHVVKASTVILAKASKDLSKTSYYLATNSLHMTTWCLQYRPTTVACVCIYLACKWANYKIPKSNEGREWFQYIDPRVTPEIIEDLYNEFLNILDKSPLKLRRKLMGLKGSGNDGQGMEDERQGPSSSSQIDPNRTSTSSHHKHTNHDRHTTPEPLRRAQGEHRDAVEGSKPAHAERNERGDPSRHSDQKHSNDRKDAHRKEIRVGEHKPGVSQHHHNAEKKIPSSHHPDPKLVKREDRREGHSHGQPHRKEVPHSAVHSENQDKASLNEKHKDLPVIKKEPHSNGQSVPAATIAPPVTTLQDIIKMEAEKPSPSVNPEPVTTELLPPTGASQSNPAPGMPSRSKTAIDFSQYLKRKEQEKREKEKQQLKMRAESELLSKSFTEGSGKERKHRPPKLDVSLPLPENHLENTKSNNHKDKSERPYNVNIKSPIKPHVSITVKSPIKSSDLKQPKLELSKVHITPEKDGSDPFSVNVNTDPAIRKLMENVKHEQDDSNSQHSHHDEYSSVTVKSEPESRGYPESVQAVVNGPVTVVNIKQEIKDEPKDEPEEGEILEPEINLNPEHSAAPSFRIKELGYDPEKGLESAAALRQAMREESELKTESGSGPNTPIRLKIPTHGSQIGSSPLKIKISTKGLSTDSDHSSGKHNSPHRHKHKHKEKHKHKHSRDKEHRHKHRDKHGHSSSSVSGTATPTNGQPSSLKMSIKLKDIPSPAAVKHKHDKHKTRASISDTALIVGGSNTAAEPDRSQPWSMTDLIPKSGSGATPQSPSRKRRRTPTVDKTTELSSQTKAAKMGPHRIRRSSSSHSVVSMELSDGDENQTSNGPQDQNTLSLLNINLMQAIAQTKQKVEIMKRNQAEGKQGALSSSARNSPLDTRPIVNRQQSGFDLEGMMWAGGTETPPLPPSVAPPLPPPEKAKPPPPPFS